MLLELLALIGSLATASVVFALDRILGCTYGPETAAGVALVTFLTVELVFRLPRALGYKPNVLWALGTTFIIWTLFSACFLNDFVTVTFAVVVGVPWLIIWLAARQIMNRIPRYCVSKR